MIEAKGFGIFSLLDEESKLPKQSAQHFTLEVHRQLGGHFRLAVPRSSRLKAHRELRDDEGFVIRHYAGGVCYQTVSFSKNCKLYEIIEQQVMKELFHRVNFRIKTTMRCMHLWNA